ncbi:MULTISPECIES: regulatory protein RecX [Candidatus Ichthyocystis]|uniref:regulatory protein RecX n=1 Tax=Candidatus Ichthyocystis TaxID=2929841 RepID=UPI000B83FA8C|nr:MULTISPECIES: RecX family transcriptional regulator [Ichthyocystis]
MNNNKELFDSLYHRGIRALARREYSQKELISLLMRYCCEEEVVYSVIFALANDGALSNKRFASSVCSVKSTNHGAYYIKKFLKAHDIDDALIVEELKKVQNNEPEVASKLIAKRLRQQPSMSPAKQRLFLKNKGFSLDTINDIFSHKQ